MLPTCLVVLFAIRLTYAQATYDTIVVGLGSAGTTAASTLAQAGKRVLALDAQDRIGGRVNTVPFGNGIVEVGAECAQATYDTIVVGLGSAGTTAASTLAQAGKRVLALDAQDRIGGRVNTVPFGNGIVEVGAECAQATYDTIVVGLGSAGTTAASTLAQAGKRVLALDAQDRIGGRVNTVPFGNGIVEVGAEWIHGSEDSFVYELAVKNNISIISDSFGELIFNSDGTPADVNVIDDIIEYMIEATSHPPKDPEPLGQYLTRRVKQHLNEKYTALANDTKYVESILHFLDLVTNNIDASNDWNDVTTESRYEELKGDQALSWHTNGYKTFFEILLNTYNNGPGYPTLEVQLNKEVTNISWPQDPVSPVLVSCKDGSSYSATNVIVTVSLGVLKDRYKTLFTPSLPEDKVTSIEKMSFGGLTKIILAFDEVWWPKKTFLGFLWSEEDRKAVPEEDKWITRVDGPSFSTGSNNTLTLWVNGQDSAKVETMPEEELKNTSMQLLRRFLGANMNITEPIAVLRSTWVTNPYILGTYSYDNLLTPQYPEARVKLGAPLKDAAGAARVLFAGEATHPSRFSTVHGAAETGLREARRILGTLVQS